MEIGIFHLTDIHFEETNNQGLLRIGEIKNAISNEFIGVKQIYVIVSGDIVNKGNSKAHKDAIIFLEKIGEIVKEITPNFEAKFIIVPGNHDCNLNNHSQLRKNTIKDLKYETIGNDDSVINNCLVVQNDFWDFYTKFNELPSNKLFYQIIDVVDGLKICFNCINTSWMTKEKEEQNLFFPVKVIEKKTDITGGALNISVFHHPIGWFSPHGTSNGRKEFQGFVEDHSSIAIYGHEHDVDYRKVKELIENKETLYFSGKVFQNEFDKDDCGFQLFLIDVSKQVGTIKSFNWKKDFFKLNIEKKFTLNGDKYGHKRFKHKVDYLKKINEIRLPILIDGIKDIKLSDLYVFPDIELIDSKKDSVNSYYDSEKIIRETDFNISLIKGENQAGKTSLANMLYHNFVELDLYPLIIDCKKITGKNPKNIIKKAFSEQYDIKEDDYERFSQFDKLKKIIILDNLNSLLFKSTTAIDLLDFVYARFGKIIIISNNLYSFQSTIESKYTKIKIFNIIPLGYKKRNQLIENYHRLNMVIEGPNEELLLQRTKDSFNKVDGIIGNELMPSYPVFVLSIIQSNHTPLNDSDQSSFGYCYQSLIHLALLKKANVSNEDIDTYFTILSEFAFNMHKSSSTSFKIKELEDFFISHTSIYHVGFSFDVLINNLEMSQLIMEEDGVYTFAYIYIYYFLVARKIAEIITTKDGKKLVKHLCKNLVDEQNANILLFTAHHTKDDFLIEEATFSTMVQFEDVSPITLELGGYFQKSIEDIAKEVSDDFVETSGNPIQAREAIMTDRDKHARTLAIQKESAITNDEIRKNSLPYIQANKAIEIVGQIIKNRKGSIPKEQLVNMIAELYNTAFRAISSYAIHLLDSKNEFITILQSKIDNTDSRSKIEQKINVEFQRISFRICLNIFGKIINSVGLKELRDLYDLAAIKVNTPAADVVTFSINSYYGKLTNMELIKITKKYEKNPVVLRIIKARALSYMYQNHVDYKKRQQFASTLKLEMKDMP